MPMRQESNSTTSPEPPKLELVQIDTLPIVTLTIHSLHLDNSPRQSGDNEEHIRVLAESEDPLPPIVVHGPSMQVIDGIHRVRAAIIRGENTIQAKIYHGTDDDAFVFAVRLNIAHGLPLNRTDRTAAARRILSSRPHWSDRMIATAVGLSAGTIAKLRRHSSAQNSHLSTRLGKDGRIRPLNSAPGRLKAAELLADKPTSSIRAIAHEAGISSSTAHDVQQRLRAGQHPLSDHHQTPQPPPPPRPAQASRNREPHAHPGPAPRIDVAAILTSLKKDPSLQLSDPTHSLLRYLDRYRVGRAGSSTIVAMVPNHCAPSVAKLAREYARIWTDIATQLEQRQPRKANDTHRN